MEVIVKLHSSLKIYSKSSSGSTKMDIPDGAYVHDILALLKVMEGEVQIILLNSEISSGEALLKDGDILELFPIFGGG